MVGADSFIGSSESDVRDTLAGSKIQCIRDQIWAFAGGLVVAQHLADILPARKHGRTLDSYLRLLAMSIRTSASELGALRDGAIDADFLVAIEGKIMILNSELTWTRSARGYNAIGTGAPYALGALYATRTTRASAVTRAESAIAAAAEHCASVSLPVHTRAI